MTDNHKSHSTYLGSRDITVPEGVNLTNASICEFVVHPTAEEKHRAEFRTDVQSALTSVRFVGGIFGPRGMEADRDVGVRLVHEYFLSGYRRTPERAYPVMTDSTTWEIKRVPSQKWGARVQIGDPSRIDSWVWKELVRMIDEAEEEHTNE